MNADIKYFKNICLNPRKLRAEISTNPYNKFGIKVGESKKRSWTNSLLKVAELIDEIEGDKRKMLIEFNMPVSKKKIDFIVLGKNRNKKPSSWILELKQWNDITEKAWNEFRIGKYIVS